MQSSCDVAIIGGGVIGLACAWRLAQGGAKAHLFERGTIGREASWAAAGMLAAQCEAAVHPPTHPSNPYAEPDTEHPAPDAFFDLCLQSRALYAGFAEELLEWTGIDIELCLAGARAGDWRKPGILYVSRESNDDAVRQFLVQRQYGQRVESSDFNGMPALWLPDEGQVDNRKLVTALKIACQKSGAILHENHETSPEELVGRYGATLLCAGCWSAPPSAEWPMVRPVAGEVLSARPEMRLDRVIYSRDVYLVPRRDGRVLIGATMTERGFDKSISPDAKTQLLKAASKLVRGAENWTIEEHWAGLRPASEDGLPILGKTSVPHLFVATGHFRNGILLTPITARLMADCVLNDTDTPEEFSMLRFDQGKLSSCA